LQRVASVLDKVRGLSLEDRFNFCFTPVNVRDPQSLGALYRYAMAFSQKIPVVVQMGAPLDSARDEFELMDLETRHQVYTISCTAGF
jgi:ATP-dependent RNA helicase SUPV3L1/SUV3